MATRPAPFGPMPPYGVLDDFLADSDRQALLQWAIRVESAFEPAKVFTGDGRGRDGVDPGLRVALKHYGVGPLQGWLCERLLAKLPTIMTMAGYNGRRPASIEFESTPMATERTLARTSTFLSAPGGELWVSDLAKIV